MKAMTTHISGIKCDAENCDYAEEFGDWGLTSEEILATADTFINKPCPLCGANLLTQADYDAISNVLMLSNELNDIFGEMPDDTEQVKVSLNLNGSGDIEMDELSKE